MEQCPSVAVVLDRYSKDTRRAVALAEEEARRLGHGHIGTEHLLLGLLAEGNNPASRSLQRAGASLALCREKVTEALASRSGDSRHNPADAMELTDRASRALDRAGRLSARLKSDRIETSHVLLSVLDVEGTAGQVLRGLSVDLAAVREGLTGRTGVGAPGEAEEPESVEPAGSGSAESGSAGSEEGLAGVAVLESGGRASAGAFGMGPVCATCGAPLDSSLGNAVVTSAAGVDFDVAYCTLCGATFGATRSAG